MKNHLLTIVLFFSFLLCVGGAQDEPKRPDPHQLKPPIPHEQIIEKAKKAKKDGFAWLVEHQNKDGSWGSHDPRIPELADFGFALRNRGGHHGVRMACTAICAHAFLEKKTFTPQEKKAFEKALGALLKPEKFAFQPGQPFNIWGYAYKLDFLTRLLESPLGKPYTKQIEQAALICIEGLRKYQLHEGGWMYYSSQMLEADSNSFTTALILTALQRAKNLKIPVPKGMIADGSKVLAKMRALNGTFFYATGHIKRGTSTLADLGAGARTAIAALALHDIGKFKRGDLIRSMEIFARGENYLEEGRKLIRPHSASHKISGYFFFFGYCYASEMAVRLAESVSQETWDRFAWTMIRTQENDGRWWDTAAGDYGDKWGTGFALLVLQRYLNKYR